MNPWDKKIIQFKSFLETRLSEHKSDVNDIRSSLHELASKASSVQVRVLIHYALECPVLAQVPNNGDLQFDTIFDIIRHNVIQTLIVEGSEYLDEYEAETN